MSQPASVFVLSGNRLFRESLGRILAKRGDMKILSTQGLSCDAYAEASASTADVLVVDSMDFLLTCLGAGKSLKNSSCRLKVLLVAMEENEEVFLRAIRAGAMGFVPKDASALDLVAAVRSVARGEAVCPPQFCKFLFAFVATQPVESRRNAKRRLTRREQQLVPMIEQGLTNKEIAQRLHLSEQTIKNHVHQILHKVGVENRMGIIAAVHSPN
jgi:DNA-binding NarL/FixJ family response regulator